jgi:large subunit ribosomal protein L24
MVDTVYKIRLKKGDRVLVRSGKYKGKSGKVIATYPRTNKVMVEGINIVKKHIKPNRKYPQGGIIDLTKPIDVSKVGIVETGSKVATRISYKINADGTKTRLFTKSGKEIK